MSLTVTLKTASSGLMAAQTGLRATSDNISNVNTPGYVRKIVNQRPMVVDGAGMGVEVTGMSRVTDQYLQLASLTATSDAGRYDAVSTYLDNVQSLFGDPTEDGNFFNRLDTIYSGFAALANDPSSTLLRSQAITNITDMLSDATRINTQISQLRQTVDAQVKADVDRVNDLLGQINKLNGDITRARMVDQDASGAENIQTGLIDELSKLMSVQVSQRKMGGVDIRSPEGIQLAGDGAASLTYSRTDTTRGFITASTVGGNPQPIQINSGEIRGLLELRDEKLPGLSDTLGEFMSRAAERLNAASNASSAVPAPASLTGRNTGLDLQAAVSGFSGTSTVAIVNSAGVLQRRVDIDFTAGTMSVDGGPAAAFSTASFDTDLNAALGGMGSVSFTNGVMQLSATSPNGVAVDEGSSMKAGRAFSHFFGLNDIIRSNGITSYETGLKGTDGHGFTGGGQITFRLAQPDGKPIKDVTVTVNGGTDMNDLMASLNSAGSGVGLYGQFSLDANGAISFDGGPPLNANVSVLQDNTQRGAGGPSISQLFGIGVASRSTRADRFSVDPQLTPYPTKMALAKLNLAAPAGTPTLTPGDGRGALLLAQSGDVNTAFQDAGALGGVTMTVSRYAMEFSGSIGREAAAAETRATSADQVKTEADARRQAVEGVNLDEELVRLTTYQQAYNASARMIQAAKELLDVLTQLV